MGLNSQPIISEKNVFFPGNVFGKNFRLVVRASARTGYILQTSFVQSSDKRSCGSSAKRSEKQKHAFPLRKTICLTPPYKHS